MLVKEPLFKGLDLRSNPLDADQSRASDCSNVYLDQSNILRNRPFFVEKFFTNGDFLGAIKALKSSTFKSFDPIYLDRDDPAYPIVSDYGYGKRKRYVTAYAQSEDSASSSKLKARVLRIYNTETNDPLVQSDYMCVDESDATKNIVIHNFQHPDSTEVGPLFDKVPTKPVSYLGVDYFLGKRGLWKYDGLFACRAGMIDLAESLFSSPFTGSGAAGTARYYRVFLASQDFTGQWVMGNYYQTPTAITSATITLSGAALVTALTGELFDNAYMSITGVPSFDGLTQRLTIPSTSKSVKAGDWITLFTSIKAKVESVSGANVVLDMTEFFEQTRLSGEFFKSIGLPIVASGEHHSNLFAVVYYSTSATEGYKLVASYPLRNGNIVFTAPTYPDASSGDDLLPFTANFADCYDEGRYKGLLDYAGNESSETTYKFIAVHNNLLLCANEKQINVSDTSTGSTVETFDPEDFFPVGTDEDGPITGLFANDEYVVVHKEKNAYLISGNIATRNFRTQSLNTNKLGAVCHWAQASLFSQNFFVSKKGAHLISGGSGIQDVGGLIEPVMRNKAPDSFGAFPTSLLDLALVNAVEDDYKDHIYVMYESNIADDYTGVMVFNYRLKEWFRWKLPLVFNFDGSNNMCGGAAAQDGKLYLTSGFDLFVETDATGGITLDDAFQEAFWTSMSRDLGVPSLEKRYTYLKIFGLSPDEIFDLDIQARYDWESVSFTDQGALTLPNSEVSPAQGFGLMDLEARRCFSFQFRVSSENYLKLNSYEVMEEMVNEEIKV